MLVNPHFEKFVRIQHDRSHKVIDAGPYRIVRHPGYAFVIPGFVLCPPLVLGSWWSFIPAAAAVTVLVIRTALEDRTLRNELPGYKEYAHRVRYRLLPGVW
jgi:protein-S-isoprenylcysteine O-methyltransferase Ste14